MSNSFLRIFISDMNIINYSAGYQHGTIWNVYRYIYVIDGHILYYKEIDKKYLAEKYNREYNWSCKERYLKGEPSCLHAIQEVLIQFHYRYFCTLKKCFHAIINLHHLSIARMLSWYPAMAYFIWHTGKFYYTYMFYLTIASQSFYFCSSFLTLNRIYYLIVQRA